MSAPSVKLVAGADQGWRGRAVSALLHPYTLFLVVALCVWLPEGFRIGDTGDGWFQIGYYLDTHSPLRAVVARVFGSLPMWLGLNLDPGGFAGLQAVMFAFAVLRGILMYEIAGRLAPGNRLFALAAGLVAEFHPADRSWFWLGASGLHFAFVTALAASLSAVIHLGTRSRASFMATILFQLLSAFCYSGFLPLMAAIPAGAWLLARERGERPGFDYLAKVGAVLLFAVLVDLLMAHYETFREMNVADFSLTGALAGYAWAVVNVALAPFELWHGLLWWFPLALAPAMLLAAAVSLAIREDAPSAAAGEWRHTALAAGGLIALAALCYLPYAFTRVRTLPDRTLLGAGLFAYCAVLLPLFTHKLAAWPRRKTFVTTCVPLLAGLVVLTGLEKRDGWVRNYREQERLLSALATAVPHPPLGSFFLVRLQNPHDSRLLNDFTMREETFIVALHYLYGDPTLSGGFYGFDEERFRFDTQGLHTWKTSQDVADYGHLIAVDYFPTDSAVNLLSRDQLAHESGLKPETIKYAPPASDSTPADGARICTMLEPSFRPDYCRR